MKKLKKGDHAPGFIAEDISGKRFETTFTGKWTFISFHRFAACPFCNLRTHELIQAFPEFLKHNADIISIWPSAKEVMNKFAGSSHAPFPVLSDPAKNIYRQYHVVHKSLFAAFRLMFKPKLINRAMGHAYKKMQVDTGVSLLPANFLINPEGKIEIAYYGKHYGDHIPLNDIFVTINKNKYEKKKYNSIGA